MDPEEKIVSFTWFDLQDTLGEEELAKLTPLQEQQLVDTFAEGICNDWTDVARAAYDTITRT